MVKVKVDYDFVLDVPLAGYAIYKILKLSRNGNLVYDSLGLKFLKISKTQIMQSEY